MRFKKLAALLLSAVMLIGYAALPVSKDTLVISAAAEGDNVNYFDGMFFWDADSEATGYKVSVTDGTKTVVDNVRYPNSYITKNMKEEGFASGTYVLRIESVKADGTTELLYTYSFDYDPGTGYTDGGNTFYYEEISANEIMITGAGNINENLVIPSVIDGKNVTKIGRYAFWGYDTIKTLTIGEGVERIDYYAFNGCYNMQSVSLPNSLEEIERCSFEGCVSLTEITIPKNVSTINSGAFSHCDSLAAINVDPDNTNFASENGVLFNSSKEALLAYPLGKAGSYTVPASVHHIEDAAFYGAHNLTAVEFLGSLDYIGFEAFSECQEITSITINEGVNYVGYCAFAGCTKLSNIFVPASVVNIGDRAFGFVGFFNDDEKISGFSLSGYADTTIYYYALRHNIPFNVISGGSSSDSPYNDTNTKVSNIAVDSSATEKEQSEQITKISVTAPDRIMSNENSGTVLASGNSITVSSSKFDDADKVEQIKNELNISENDPVSLVNLDLKSGGTDISTTYDGLVRVAFDIPPAFDGESISCHRIIFDDSGNVIGEELIPGEQTDDTYTVYLEHFSTYGLVAGADVVETTYTVTVTGGTADKTSAAAGEEVTVTATIPEGKQFKQWTVTSGGITLANTSSASFTMPAGNVKIEAVFEDKETSSSGSGSSSSSSNSGSLTSSTPTNNTTPSDTKKPETPAEPAITVKNQNSTPVSIDWNAKDGADGYVVEALNSKGEWERIALIKGGDNTSFDLDSLTPAKNYTLRVRPYTVKNGKRYIKKTGEEITVTTAPKKTANFKSAKATKNSIKVTWKKDKAADGYQLQIYKNGKWSTIKTYNNNKYIGRTINGLKSGTTYKLRIRSFKLDENGKKVYGKYSTISVKTK